MRVGIDQRLAAYRMGGIARYAIELGNALERFDTLELVKFGHAKESAPGGNRMLLRTPPHHRLESQFLRLELALRRASIDVFHATDFVPPGLGGTATVATVHDLAFLRWPDQLEANALAYYRQILNPRRHPTLWITPSEWTRNDLCEQVGVDPATVFVIPHGASSFLTDVGIVPRAVRRPYLVTVGTVEPRKRYDLLLDALALIDERPELVIAGQPGWNSDAIQRRLRTDPSVTWLDTTSDLEIRRLIAGAVALALPSLEEGFGLSALEAMACGTPVVSSGHGALPEVTGGAAMTPRTDDPQGWAAELERVMLDIPAWRQASTEGFERSRHFTWERAAESTLEVYQRALG